MTRILKTLLISSLAVLVFGVAGVQSAEAGHKHKTVVVNVGGPGFGFGYYSGPKWHRPVRPICPPPVYVTPVYPAPIVIAPVCPPVHVHSFAIVCEQEWVPPVYNTVVVGYDHCGKPVYSQVCVQAGYYRTAKYQVCGCGQRIFLGYV